MQFPVVRGAGVMTGLLAGLLLAAVSSAAQAGDDAPVDADKTAALDQALNFDPATLSFDAPVHTLRLPSLSHPPSLDVSRAGNPDGSSTVVVKQPVSADWNAKVGVDLGLAAPAPVSDQPDEPLPGSAGAKPSRAAWASIGVVPNLATIDGRVDPGSDQGRVATTFARSVPVGSRYSVTLSDSYAMTGSFGAPGSAPAALPQQTANVWSNERGVQFNIKPTGTTLSAGLASTSIDPVTHNTLSADQRLYGPLHVTTTVTDVGETYSNKSISAGLKLNW